MTSFFYGICVGGLLAMVIANHQPIFVRVISAEGGGRVDRFVVDCGFRSDGRVKCWAEVNHAD